MPSLVRVRRIRIVAVAADATRKWLAKVADTVPIQRGQGPGSRECGAIVARRAKPVRLVSRIVDGAQPPRGTELTSTALPCWSRDHGGAWHSIAPGTWTRNALVEACKHRLRDQGAHPILHPLAGSGARHRDSRAAGPQNRHAAHETGWRAPAGISGQRGFQHRLCLLPLRYRPAVKAHAVRLPAMLWQRVPRCLVPVHGYDGVVPTAAEEAAGLLASAGAATGAASASIARQHRPPASPAGIARQHRLPASPAPGRSGAQPRKPGAKPALKRALPDPHGRRFVRTS